MNKNLKIFTIISCLLFTPLLHAKGDKKNYSLGVNVNSNSYFIGGIDFRIKHFQGGKAFLLFEGVNVKHPNEVRWASGFNGNNVLGNKPFVLGKTNYLFVLRSQIGLENVLFHKDQHNGVQVNFNLAGGPSIGFEKPYYIRYQYTSEQVEIEQYQSGVHQPNDILGSAGAIYKFEESSIVPGLNARLSLDFEYGNNRKFSSSIETGFLLEAFARPIQIIDGVSPNAYFASAFVVLYVGKN